MHIERTAPPDLLGTLVEHDASRRRSAVLIKPSGRSLRLDGLSLGGYWELLYFLAWRDVKVRYKQMAIGAGWAIIQPLVTMMLFTLVFSGIANISTGGVPYPLFAYAALVPWTYFSLAMGRSSTSLVANATLLTKVYFPRLIIPLSAVISSLVDFAAAFLLLVAMMAWYRVMPGLQILAVPVFLGLSMLTALAVALWLSAICVKYRDVAVIMPFLVQVWMFASPVAYPVRLVPEKWRLLYSLNPMAGVLEGFRWALLGSAAPDLTTLAASSAGVIVVLYGGLLYFRHTERGFADLV